MHNVTWTTIEVHRAVSFQNSCLDRVIFPMFMLVLSTPTATHLSHGIPNDDIQLSIVVKSSSAVPPFDTHMSRRLVFTFPRLISQIRTVSGLILSIPLSLEPSVARENGDFYICVIKAFLEKRNHRNKVTIECPTYNRMHESDSTQYR